jgi:ABC-2 type transport system permease protein
MLPLFRAEFLKLRSTRTALGLLIAALVVSLVPAILVMALVDKATLLDGGTVFAALGLTMVPMLTLVFGILGMTNEYRHGTITYTYLSAPRRGFVILVKLVSYGLVGAAVMAVTGLLVIVAIGAVAAIRHFSVTDMEGFQASSLGTLGNVALFVATVGLMTAFGVALGALLRAQVPTVAGTLIWALFIEGIVVALKPGIGKYLPFEAFSQLTFGMGGETPGVTMLARPQAFLLSIAYIAAVSVGAIYLSMRRDVT